MRMVYFFLLQAFDDDILCNGGLAAQLLEGSVFWRVIPLLKPLHALEFKYDQALGIPFTFERLDLARGGEVLLKRRTVPS